MTRRRLRGEKLRSITCHEYSLLIMRRAGMISGAYRPTILESNGSRSANGNHWFDRENQPLGEFVSEASIN
jgi:hypothetical protein